MGGGGGGSPDIIEMPNREDFVHQQTREINAMQSADNQRAMRTGNFLKHDTWKETMDQFNRGTEQGRGIMNSLTSRSVRDDDTRTKGALQGQYTHQAKLGREVLRNQEKIDKYNVKNAGAAGGTEMGAANLNANARAWSIANQGTKALNQQRLQLADIVNSHGSSDANWMVAGAAGAYGAYTGIRNQQQADQQLANARALGQSMYADAYTTGGMY
jgi:hypothetical protein